MKITVITVCYNAQDLIEETIKSVIMQTYKNIEYIVIDGASSDSTINILEKHRQNIDILVSEKDTGIFNAMNKAVSYASGDFLLFLNAGDTFFSENIIEAVIPYLNNSKEELFFGDINVIEPNGANWIKSFANTDKITLASNCLCHQAIFYTRKLFEKIGEYDESCKICADHDFNLKALIKYKHKAKYIPAVISNFRMGGFSTSRNNIKNTSQEISLLAEKYYGNLKLKYFKFILSIIRNLSNIKLKTAIRKVIVYLFNLNI